MLSHFFKAQSSRLCSNTHKFPFFVMSWVGVAFTTGTNVSQYWLPDARRSLRMIRPTGSNVIQISAYLYQVGLKSVRPGRQTSERALAFIIRRVRRAGYKVFLKPTVYVTDEKGEYLWRGNIPPTWQWFDRLYIPYMMRMAWLARRERVDILSVGSEYVKTEKATGLWRHTIRRVRSVYKGELTYIANHDSYFKVKFWHQLDFISLAAYFKLVPKTQKFVPSVQRTTKMIAYRAYRIQTFRRRAGLLKKGVLIAEVGFQSKGGLVNYLTPWDWDAEGPRDVSSQTRMYRIFTSVFLSQRWSLGMIFWHWEPIPNAGRTYARKGYTPQGKPALTVMTRSFKRYCQWFSSASFIAIPAILFSMAPSTFIFLFCISLPRSWNEMDKSYY